MNAIQLIFSDNEGCIIPGKGIPFPLNDLAQLRKFLKNHPNVGFGICTGRSVPYIEAMVQAIDLINSPVPCICEGGATLYWPKTDTWEVLFPFTQKEDILNIISNINYREEPGKIACLSLYPNLPATVDSLYDAFINSSIKEKYNITKSIAAVDITAKGVSKSLGVKEVCKLLGISLAEILYIGDAQNDIELLKLAGFSGCPNNAIGVVKDCVDYVSTSDATLGVLDILKHFEPFFIPNSF